MAASRAHYLSAAFTSAWCSRSKRTVESFPYSAANKIEVLPSLHKKPQTSDKRQSTRRSIKNMTRDDSHIKSALPGCCIHISMVLQEQADSGILVKERSHTVHQRSFHISVYKKHQATENLQATMRSSIDNMTQDESRIKGALLVHCIHVSMVLKEQKDNGISFT